MNPISTQELLSIQQDTARAACDQPCVIQRAVRTPRPSGGASTTMETVSPNGLLAGMSEPTAGQLQNYGYLVANLAAWQVKFPIGTDVKHGDQLVIGGQTLEVHVILNPRSYPALLTVLAAEVK